MSVYLPNIPAANELISQSQPQIQNNFSELNTIFMSDHVEYDNAIVANRGKHTNIRFVQQAGDPVTLVNEVALYTKAVGGVPRLFIREQSNGTAYQLNANTPSAATTGYTWLPGGLLMQWGDQSSVGANPVIFPVAFSTAYQVVGITNANDRPFAVTIMNAANFTFSIDNPVLGVNFRWVAIGAA